MIWLINLDVIGLQDIDDRAALLQLFPTTEWSVVIDANMDKQDVACVTDSS